MDDALVLGDYLPVSFKTRSEQEYLVFLLEALES
jgi:hypothetical protein